VQSGYVYFLHHLQLLFIILNDKNHFKFSSVTDQTFKNLPKMQSIENQN